jgi:hypothetical protein
MRLLQRENEIVRQERDTLQQEKTLRLLKFQQETTCLSFNTG